MGGGFIMVQERNRIIKLLLALTVTTSLLFSLAFADSVKQTINIVLAELNRVFRSIDNAAALKLAAKRDEIPKQIASYTESIQPTLLHEVNEIQANIDEHKELTGLTSGVPLWPTKEQMMSHVNPLVDATYDLSYQALLADGLMPYLAETEHIEKELAEFLKNQQPTPGPGDPTPTPIATPTRTPCVFCLRYDGGSAGIIAMGDGGSSTASPPTASLIKGINMLKADAAKIRAGAASIGRYRVGGASSAAGIAKSLSSVSSQLQALRGQHTIVDGAVEGLITGLDRLLERSQDMAQRYDYFNQGYADALVDKANQLLETNATERLDKEADFLDFVRGELEVALKSIVLKEGAEPGMLAYQIVKELPKKVAERIAAAQSAVGGLVDKATTERQAAEKFWFEYFRHFCRHCFHEVIASSAINPIYDMADEFKRLSKPEYLLTQLNIDAQKDIMGVVALDKAFILPDTEAKVRALAESASRSVAQLFPPGSPAPAVPQMRFSGACGQYVPDPNSAAFNFINPDDFNKSLEKANNGAKRLSRELNRRKQNGFANCAPSHKPCIKKAQKAAQKLKLVKKVKGKISKRVKRIIKELPVHLNKAYFNSYGKYPYRPFR
jgi:hypothetical protein